MNTIGQYLSIHPQSFENAELLLPLDAKMTIANRRVNFEIPTLTALWSYCQSNPEDIVFYLHTKGASKNVDSQMKEYMERSRDREFWRRELEYFLLERHVDCTKHLMMGWDVCGPDFRPSHRWKHFQGNFWWARCSYVSKIKSPLQPKIEGMHDAYKQITSKNRGSGEGLHTFVPSGRFLAEWWLCSSPKKSIFRYSQFHVISCHNPRQQRRRFRYSGSTCDYMGYVCNSQPNFLKNLDINDILRYKNVDLQFPIEHQRLSAYIKKISNPQFWSCKRLCNEGECKNTPPF